MTPANLVIKDTVVIDSMGRLFDILTPVAIKENAVNGQKDGRTLSQKGYGAVALKIRDFTNLIEDLNKDVIYICHCTEMQDDDGTIKVRLSIPGQTRDKMG